MSEQIFVSYRREGGDVTAKLVCEALKNRGYTVFYDYDSISGGYFDSRILDAIEECSDFVLVLPPHSLDRCVNDDDWVRQEIFHALKYGKNIIPVMLPGFEFPPNMPEDIADVSRYNGVQFVMAYFDGVIDTLVDRFIAKPLLRSMTSAYADAPKRTHSEGLSYEMNSAGTGYTVKKGKCTDEEIIIPRIYNGRAVTEIAEDGFKGHASLVSIVIPNGVTTIGKGAFNGCVSLTSIALPSTLLSIGKWAFQDCGSLANIFIPKNVSSVASRAFLNCQSLVNIEVDSENNFYCSRGGHLYTKNMKTLVCYATGRGDAFYNVPNGVVRIEDSAFSRASSLVSISIPESVNSIGEYAFYNCTSLAEINIPDGITAISTSMFSTCSSLAKVKIPRGVTTIGSEAFIQCSSLTSIDLPDGITSIAEKAFKKCTSLASIRLPKNLTAIGDQAFMNCSALTSMQLPAGVTNIGASAFSTCTSLVNISIPEGVSVIGKWAFEECTSLTSIYFPRSVANVSPRVFLNCQSLINIDVSPENSFYCSVGGHLYTKDMRTLISYAIGRKEAFYAVPDGVVNIEDSAFSRCTSLVSVVLPKSVKSIGMYAFFRCKNLASLDIPDGVDNIGEQAFRECTSLPAIKLPGNLTSIGESFFDNCHILSSVKIPASVTSIGKWAFSTCSALKEVTIPKNVSSIGARAFLDCKALKSINVSMWNRHYRSVGGHLYTKDMKKLVSYAIGNGVPSYTVPPGVTVIEESTFSHSEVLASITIPATVTSIGDFAFYSCSALRSIYYLGTRDAWRRVNVGKSTFNKLNNAVLHCADGDINL